MHSWSAVTQRLNENIEERLKWLNQEAQRSKSRTWSVKEGIGVMPRILN